MAGSKGDIREDLKIAVAYYVAAYTFLYGMVFSIHTYTADTIADKPAFIFLINILLLLVFLLVAYVFYRRMEGRAFKEFIGFKREGLVESLTATAASFTALNLVLAILAYSILGVNPLARFIENVYTYCSTPWFNRVDPKLLPVAAVMLWFVSGTFHFALMQAFPYEVLSGRPKKYVILLVSALSILYYNLPLLTGEWKLDDIVFLGIVCPLIYHLYRNSLGIILNYVFFYEMPVLVAFLKGWGEKAFWIFFVGRLIWGSTCLSVFAINRLKSKILSHTVK